MGAQQVEFGDDRGGAQVEHPVMASWICWSGTVPVPKVLTNRPSEWDPDRVGDLRLALGAVAAYRDHGLATQRIA